MRLIDADALEKAISNKMKEVRNTPSGGDIEFMNYLDGRFSGMQVIFDLIEEAPDEHFPPAPQWISVDERLPELCEQMLDEDIDGETLEEWYSRPVIAHDRYVNFTYIARLTDTVG